MYNLKPGMMPLVSSRELADIVEGINDAINKGLFISIQLEEFMDEETVYGIYTMTEAEVTEYNRCGGTWEYSKPQEFLSEPWFN